LLLLQLQNVISYLSTAERTPSEVHLFDSSLHFSSRSLTISFIVDDKGKHLSAHTKEAIWQRIQPFINQQHVHIKGTVLRGEIL